jgi:mRNA-degrading endonuclease RelE of RelBE toxin-antitoxin system
MSYAVTWSERATSAGSRYRVLYEIDVVAQSITVLHVGRLA